jgi:hypothetical protein
MSKIKDIDSAPEYITRFLNENMKKLIEIYDGSKNEQGYGTLGFKCSESENTMDVFYMNEENMINNIGKESWETLKENMKDKKLFFINDIDINETFLVYI